MITSGVNKSKIKVQNFQALIDDQYSHNLKVDNDVSVMAPVSHSIATIATMTKASERDVAMFAP